MTIQLQVECGGSTLSNVLLFDCTNGRHTKSEMFSSSTASITCRIPSGLPASFVLEALVTVVYITGGVTYYLHQGYISNISYSYGVVQAMDTATISLEGYLSFMGRGQLNAFALTGGTTGAEAVRVGNALTGTAKTVANTGTKSVTDTSTYTGAAQNVITKLVATEQGRLGQGGTSLYFYGRDVLTDATASPYFYSNWAFTDSNPASNGWAYDEVTFASLTDNYFTQITVTPASVAAQQAGTGSRNLSLDTYDGNTTQASNLAQYALAEFNSNTSVPVAISTRESLKNYQSPAKIVENIPVGWRLPITLRGVTYHSVIEGWTVTADPEDIRYTFFVSGFQQNNFLQLGDSVYGKLDSNKLGY